MSLIELGRPGPVALRAVFLEEQRKWLDLKREGKKGPVVSQLVILFERDFVSSRLSVWTWKPLQRILVGFVFFKCLYLLTVRKVHYGVRGRA